MNPPHTIPLDKSRRTETDIEMNSYSINNSILCLLIKLIYKIVSLSSERGPFCSKKRPLQTESQSHYIFCHTLVSELRTIWPALFFSVTLALYEHWLKRNLFKFIHNKATRAFSNKIKWCKNYHSFLGGAPCSRWGGLWVMALTWTQHCSLLL